MYLRGTVILILMLWLQGCAISNNPKDPFEKVNRATYAFNKAFDKVFLKPVARVYDATIPRPIKIMVSNFFQNLGDISTFANEFLQKKYTEASQDYARFAVNSTLGVGGLFDVASQHKLVKRRVDVGQTMAFWGYKDSIYVVLPFFGPSTMRDSIGRGLGYFMNIWPYMNSVKARNIGFALGLIDTRVRLLSTERIIDAAAIDEYVFVRDAYFQNRQYEIDKLTGVSTTKEEEMLGEAPE